MVQKFFGRIVCVCFGTVGKKRKASVNKNTSADKSELEGAAEAEESQQVHLFLTFCDM